MIELESVTFDGTLWVGREDDGCRISKVRLVSTVLVLTENLIVDHPY